VNDQVIPKLIGLIRASLFFRFPPPLHSLRSTPAGVFSMTIWKFRFGVPAAAGVSGLGIDRKNCDPFEHGFCASHAISARAHFPSA